MGTELTIAIPTFNRYETLKACLDSISNQWDDTCRDRVEVIISDNASEDATENIVQYPAFQKIEAKYYRNKENLGPDRNFFNCWEKSNGKYVLLLSDDDLLLDGTLKGILEGIKDNPDILYLTCSRWKDRGIKYEGVEHFVKYNNDADFLNDLGLTIVVLSSLVLRKENIDISNLEKYVGTFFTQMYAVIDVMKKGDKKYTIRRNPSIGQRPDNQRGYNLYDTWLVEYQNVLLHFTELGLPESFCRRIFRQSFKEHIRHWLNKFARLSTRLDVSVGLKPILRTLRYPESYVYLYPYMIKLAIAKRNWSQK